MSADAIKCASVGLVVVHAAQLIRRLWTRSHEEKGHEDDDGEDARLRARAERTIASLTHLRVSDVSQAGLGFSQFYESASGCHVVSVDGRRFIDYLCTYGPIVLGHCHHAVDAAVRRQQASGVCLPGPPAAMVELSELLVDMVPFAAWAMFMKNGTDATSAAVRIARAKTGKRVILRAPGSYHGASGLWKEHRCFEGGVLPEEHAYQLPFTFNDVASVRAAADEAGDDFAGIVCAAFKWDVGQPAELPSAEFLAEIRRVCDERNAVLICDDVRSSLRLSLTGSWDAFGDGDIAPDLTCMCKGIANGYPLACVLGSESMRTGVAKMSPLTGSFWCNGDSFAAAIATIKTMRSVGGIERMRRLGTALRDGLLSRARAIGIEDFHVTGPPQMPYFHFDSELAKPLADRDLIRKFVGVCVQNGIIFHPSHTMFLSVAHTDCDIAETLRVSERAFAEVKAMRRGVELPGPCLQPTQSWWLENMKEDETDDDDEDVPERVRHCIIGCGMTGTSVAYWMNTLRMDNGQDHGDVIILDCRGVAGGATGRNGGHLTPNASSEFEMKTTRELVNFIAENAVNCDLQRGGKLSRREKEIKGPDGTPAEEDFNPESYQFFPARVCAALLKSSDARVFRIRALSIQNGDGRNHKVSWQRDGDAAATGVILAENVIVATNGYAAELLPELSPYMYSTRNQVIMTAPLENTVFNAGAMGSVGAGGEEVYVIQRADNRICIGGARSLEKDRAVGVKDDTKLNEDVGKYLRLFLTENLRLNEVPVEAEWTGVLGFSTDRKPFIGSVRPGVFVAAAFCGHGMPQCFGAGKAIALMLLDRRADVDATVLDQFSPSRFLPI